MGSGGALKGLDRGGMAQQGADGNGYIGVTGVPGLDAPNGADVVVQINDPLLPQEHSRHANRHLGDGGNPDFVVRRHGGLVLGGPAVGVCIHQPAVFHHRHLESNSAVLGGGGVNEELGFFVEFLAERDGDAGAHLGSQPLGHRLAGVIGGEGHQYLGQLCPGDRQAGVDAVRDHAGEEAVFQGPGHRLPGLFRNSPAAGVGVQLAGVGPAILLGGEPVEECGQIRAPDRLLGAQVPAWVHEARLDCPGRRTGVPGVWVHVVKEAVPTGLRLLAAHALEGREEDCPGHQGVRVIPVRGHAAQKSLMGRIADAVRI